MRSVMVVDIISLWGARLHHQFHGLPLDLPEYTLVSCNQW